MIIKNFAQISNSSFFRIQDLILYNLNHFFSRIKNHQTFDVEKFLEEILEGIGTVFSMLMKNYSRKLWKFVYDNFTTLYIQMIVIMSQKYKSKESAKMIKKVEEETEIFQDFFEDKVGRKDFKMGTEKINDLIKALTGNPEEIVQHIFNLRVKLREKFNEKCMKCIMRLRPDFNKKKKAKVFKMMEEEEEKIRKESKRNVAKLFYKQIMTEFRIHQFVQKFRIKMHIRNEIMRKRAQKEQDRSVKNINENERLVNSFYN